jgi:hypothetical protein
MEYLAMKGAKELELPQIFAVIVIPRTLCDLFMALIIVRIGHPDNVRSALWRLKDTSGLEFLLGKDFQLLNDVFLHRACDALLSKMDEIVDRVYKLYATPDIATRLPSFMTYITYILREGRSACHQKGIFRREKLGLPADKLGGHARPVRFDP